MCDAMSTTPLSYLPYQTAPLEAIFRSALLVLLDNASAEFAFIKQFFKTEAFTASPPPGQMPSHRRIASIDSIGFSDAMSRARPRSEFDGLRSPGADTVIEGTVNGAGRKTPAETSEEKKMLENIWKQIFEPSLPYVQVHQLFSSSPEIMVD